MRRRLKGTVLWLTAIGYTAAVLWVGSRSNPVPGLRLTGGMDKILHAGAYGLLALLLARAIFHSWRTGGARGAAVLAAVLATTFGAIDEFHQSFVPGRHGSVGDVLADGVGAIAGAAFFVLLLRLASGRDAGA